MQKILLSLTALTGLLAFGAAAHAMPVNTSHAGVTQFAAIAHPVDWRDHEWWEHHHRDEWRQHHHHHYYEHRY